MRRQCLARASVAWTLEIARSEIAISGKSPFGGHVGACGLSSAASQHIIARLRSPETAERRRIIHAERCGGYKFHTRLLPHD